MKKFSILAILFTVICIGNLHANTIGVLGRIYDPGFSVTASFDQVEVELGITEIASGTLSLSGDYQILDGGIMTDLSWNVAAGAAVGISSSGLTVSIITPAEVVYDIDELLKGMDIYLQLKPIIPLYPSPSFDIEFGLGVRIDY